MGFTHTQGCRKPYTRNKTHHLLQSSLTRPYLRVPQESVVWTYDTFDNNCGMKYHDSSTGELGYDGPLYDRFLHMTDDMLGPSPMHIKYSSYVYDRFCL